jgi:hypothetical protein
MGNLKVALGVAFLAVLLIYYCNYLQLNGTGEGLNTPKVGQRREVKLPH